MFANDPGDARGTIVDSHAPEILDHLDRLLIIRLRNLGDCILMTPVLEVLKQWKTGLNISVLVESAFAAVFEGNANVDRLMVPAHAKGFLGKYRGRMETVKRLRSMSFDLVWNLHGGSTSLLYSLSPRSRYVLGFRHYRNAARYSHLVPAASEVWRKSDLHTVFTQLAPLRWLGLPFDEREIKTSVHCTESGEETARNFLRENGMENSPFVLVQPTATLRTKQWPEPYFAELIQRIQRRFDLKFVISAGPGEEGVAKRVVEKVGGSLPVFGGHGINALKSMIARCSFFIGNDSGPAHLAAALRRPVLVLFGSSNFAAWRPWGIDYEAVRSDLDCIPCPGYRCYEYDEPRCIGSIRPSIAFEAFCRLQERNPHSYEETVSK